MQTFDASAAQANEDGILSDAEVIEDLTEKEFVEVYETYVMNGDGTLEVILNEPNEDEFILQIFIP